MDRMIYSPLVSIVIPTFNSATDLERCLDSLEGQTYLNFEIIVVDNFSTDNTLKIAEARGVNVFQEKCNVSQARNYGIKYARGEVILFIDDDQLLSSGLIEECVELFQDPAVDAIIIPEVFSGYSFLSEGLKFEKTLVSGDLETEIPRFYRTPVLLELGGFDSRLVFGEDWDLYRRFQGHGYQVRYARNGIVHHEDPSPSNIIRKYVNYGRSLSVLVSKQSKHVYSRYTFFPTGFWIFFKKFVECPRMGFEFIVLRLVKGVSLFFGTMISQPPLLSKNKKGHLTKMEGETSLSWVVKRNLDVSGRVQLLRRLVRDEVLTMDVGSSFSDLSHVRIDIDSSKSPDVLGSALRLPIRDSIFRQIVFSDVVEHLPPSMERVALSEIFRVMVEGGSLIFSTPNGVLHYMLLDLTWWIFKHRHYDKKTIYELFSKTGFNVKWIFTAGGLFSSINFLLICMFVFPLKLIFKREFPVGVFSTAELSEYSKDYLDWGYTLYAVVEKPVGCNG
jgi:glycosyltransferase involved in cell wall biosynthesis